VWDSLENSAGDRTIPLCRPRPACACRPRKADPTLRLLGAGIGLQGSRSDRLGTLRRRRARSQPAAGRHRSHSRHPGSARALRRHFFRLLAATSVVRTLNDRGLATKADRIICGTNEEARAFSPPMTVSSAFAKALKPGGGVLHPPTMPASRSRQASIDRFRPRPAGQRASMPILSCHRAAVLTLGCTSHRGRWLQYPGLRRTINGDTGHAGGTPNGDAAQRPGRRRPTSVADESRCRPRLCADEGHHHDPDRSFPNLPGYKKNTSPEQVN